MTACKKAVSERRILDGCANVPTAQSRRYDILNSADACWCFRDKNNTGTLFTVKDRVTATWHGQQSASPIQWGYLP